MRFVAVFGIDAKLPTCERMMAISAFGMARIGDKLHLRWQKDRGFETDFTAEPLREFFE